MKGRQGHGDPGQSRTWGRLRGGDHLRPELEGRGSLSNLRGLWAGGSEPLPLQDDSETVRF